MGKWWGWGVERGHKTQRQCNWWAGVPVGVGQGHSWNTRVSNPPEVLWEVWGSESQGPPPPHHALTHGSTVLISRMEAFITQGFSPYVRAPGTRGMPATRSPPCYYGWRMGME